MKRAVGIAVAIFALVLLVGLAFTLNPGAVDVRLTPSRIVQLPLGILLVGTFVLGAVIAILAVALQQLGRRLAQWGEARRAKQEAQLAELNERGAALGWSGDLERSRAVFKKAWRKDPHNKEAALALAASYTDTGENAAAKQVLEAAVAELPNDPDLRYALGEALRRNGEIGAAIRMQETIRVQYPTAPRVLLALRELYRAAQQWKEAADVQELYIRQMSSSDDLGPEREDLRTLRFREALRIADPNERAAALMPMAENDPSFAAAVEAAGQALIAAGRNDEAQRLWEKSLRRAPRLSTLESLLDLQTQAAGRNRVVDLLGRYGGALDADEARLLRARAALRNDDLERAQEALDGVSNQGSAAVQRCWADLYSKRGNYDRAWTALAAAADAGE